jgi:hypothetical protein
MLNLTRTINPTHDYTNEWVEVEPGIYAHRFSIIGTSSIDYDVYEPGQLGQTHSSYFHHELWGWLGKLNARRLPAELEGLPGWKPGYWPEERIAKVKAWQAELDAQAEAFIKQTFPQDFI